MLLKDNKQYNRKQLKLLDIWREYERAARELQQPITRIIFINKSPKNASNDKRNLAGLPARCINKLNDFEEIQEMTLENFLYLMVKMGIEIEMEDEK
jgi:hypothetical protein